LAAKHDLTGIGSASATLTFVALAGSPLSFLTQGFLGKVTHYILTQIYSRLASQGLVVLNIGVARVQTLVDRKEFDGTFDDAFDLINKSGGRLSQDDIKAIDDKVIRALRKFTDFGVRERRNP
jgi:hypothetical protein